MSEKDRLEQEDMKVSQENVSQDRGSKLIKESFHMLFYMVLIFLASYMILHFIGQRTQVLGQSMENTLSDQDNLIIDKVSYHFINPRRYDIIVFPEEDSDGIYYIKRIIGLPGETIQIVNGDVYINDELLEENFGKEKIAFENEGIAVQPTQIGEDEYFVLGDNRNHSTDSRDPNVGNVPKTFIVGKAWIRVWPFDQFGLLRQQ